MRKRDLYKQQDRERVVEFCLAVACAERQMVTCPQSLTAQRMCRRQA